MALTLLEHTLPEVMDAHASEESLLLVCTNGQRDLCCARFGLPLFESLRIEFDARVWQTTHVGGHRYAPNLVCLPSGMVYGFVDPEQGVGLVHDHDQNMLRLSHMRGRSSHPPLLQAAEYFVLSHWAEQASAQTPHCDSGLAFAEEGEWVHYQSATHGSGRLHMRKIELAPVLASCGAAPKPDYEYQLISLEVSSTGQI